MSMTATLNGTLTVTDSDTGTTALSKTVNLSFAGILASIANTLSVGTGGTSPTIPNTTANFVYIKNTHATNTLTVAWTPNGGSTATIQTLEPGSAIFLTQITTGGGITALTLTGSATGTTVEMILLG